MNNNIEILRATKERLLTKGWRKDGRGDVNGSLCLINSMTFSALDLRSRYDDQSICGSPEMYDTLAEYCNCPPDLIHIWNDDPSTTFEDVIDVVDKAILHFSAESAAVEEVNTEELISV